MPKGRRSNRSRRHSAKGLSSQDRMVAMAGPILMVRAAWRYALGDGSGSSRSAVFDYRHATPFMLHASEWVLSLPPPNVNGIGCDESHGQVRRMNVRMQNEITYAAEKHYSSYRLCFSKYFWVVYLRQYSGGVRATNAKQRRHGVNVRGLS